MKFCICNETYQEWTWNDTCRSASECGYRYIEIAPFTLAPDIRSLSTEAKADIRATAALYGLQIVGLHWLLVSPKGLSLTGEDCLRRAETADYLKALVQLCADLGGQSMVLGSPAQRRLPATTDGSEQSRIEIATERLVHALRPALDEALLRNVTLCLEPLPAPESDFVLTLSDAVSIVRQVDHPSLKTMLDVKSASADVAPIPELIKQYISLIAHVHVNDVNRRGPGFGNTDFVPILKALMAAGYAGPVSVEVFDYSPDPVTIAQKSLDYLNHCLHSVPAG